MEKRIMSVNIAQYALLLSKPYSIFVTQISKKKTNKQQQQLNIQKEKDNSTNKYPFKNLFDNQIHRNNNIF